MPAFGKKSLDILKHAHKDLQTICKEAIKYYDFSVVCSYRSSEEQFELYKQGRDYIDGNWLTINNKKVVTRVDGQTVKSSHNFFPSLSVDLYPYPWDFKKEIEEELRRFFYLAGVMHTVSTELFMHKDVIHKLKWGMDWNMNQVFTDENFHDMPHFELLPV